MGEVLGMQGWEARVVTEFEMARNHLQDHPEWTGRLLFTLSTIVVATIAAMVVVARIDGGLWIFFIFEKIIERS